MQRFFISPTTFAQQPITLTGDQAHQVRRVLRMRLGDRAILLDGQGHACEAVLIVVGDADVRFQVVRHWETDGEPVTQVVLYQAVLKGERFGWALQKGVEIGVSVFVPIICERNVVDDMDAVEGKRERWEHIIQEAAEQSGRGRLPVLAPAQLFGQAVLPTLRGSLGPCRDVACNVSTGVRLILWEGEQEVRLCDALAGCNFASGAGIQVFVGPEGGFTEGEVSLARRYGIQPVTLGPRILRAETAGVIAAALILYTAGDI